MPFAGNVDYTALPLYSIDCTLHFPSLKHMQNEGSETFSKTGNIEYETPPPGLLIQLQRLNVPCGSGGYVRFNDHALLCGKLEELPAEQRSYHFDIRHHNSVRLHHNPMFSLSYKLVDYCYNISSSNQSGEFFIQPSRSNALECFFRIHLPYGNKVHLKLLSNKQQQQQDASLLFEQINYQLVNLTAIAQQHHYASNSENKHNSSNLNNILTSNEAFSFLSNEAFDEASHISTANCEGVIIKVFERNSQSKWSHCVLLLQNDVQGFLIESSSNVLSVHLYRPTTTSADASIHVAAIQLPSIYLSYQAVAVPEIMSNCAFGWIAMQQFCISAIELALPWHAAEQHCVELGGHLASIRNDQQQQIVNSLLLNSPGYRDDSAYWVGGSDKSYESDFRWSDGLQFLFTSK